MLHARYLAITKKTSKTQQPFRADSSITKNAWFLALSANTFSLLNAPDIFFKSDTAEKMIVKKFDTA